MVQRSRRNVLSEAGSPLGRLLETLALCALLFIGCSRRVQIHDSTTGFQLDSIRVALNSFEIDCRRYPTTSEGLSALLEDLGIPGWHGPYLETNEWYSSTNLLTGQWNTPLRYRKEDSGPIIVSAGADKTFGTTDDLTKK